MKEGRRESRGAIGEAAAGDDDEWFQSLIAQYGFDDDDGVAGRSSFDEIERTNDEIRWSPVSDSASPSESRRSNNNYTVKTKSRPRHNQREHPQAVKERHNERPETSQNTRRRTSSKSKTSSFATTKSSRQKSGQRNENKCDSTSISSKTRRRSDRNSRGIQEKTRKKDRDSKISSKYYNRNKTIPTTLDLSMLKSHDFDTRKVNRINLYHRVRASLLENMQLSIRLFADWRAELELLSAFPASTKENNDHSSPEIGQTVSLLKSLLQNSESIDFLFKELMIPLMDEVWITIDDLCGTQTLTALCRLTFLCRLQTSHLQHYSVNPHASNGVKKNPVPELFTWCQRSETVHATLFEMLNHEIQGLFWLLGIADNKFESQIQYAVSEKLKAVWKAAGHEKALEAIRYLYEDEQGSSAMRVQRNSIFSEACCDVLASMDQWCPAHPTMLLKFHNSTLNEWQTLLDAPIHAPLNPNDCSESSAYGLDSDFSSGLYSDEKLAPIPEQAERALLKISVPLLSRQDAVERVIKRILPFHNKGQDSGHCNDTVSSLNTTLTLEVNLLEQKNKSNQDPQEPNKEVIDRNRSQTKQTIVAIAPSPIAGRFGATDTTKGTGKTTVAALVAHNPEVRSYYIDGVIWLSFQHSPGTHLSYGRYRCLLEDLVSQVQRSSVQIASGDTSPDKKQNLALPEFPDMIPIFQGKSQSQIQRQNLEEGFKTHCYAKMAKFLQNKRILLILDNLPDVETLRWFKFLQVSKPETIGSEFTGSSIVVTTSSRGLLSASETVALDLFTTEEAVNFLTLRSIHLGTADFADMSQTINMAKLFHPTHVASVCSLLDYFCCHCPCEKRNTYLKKFCYTIATDIQRDGFPSPTINHILGRGMTPSTILMKSNSEAMNRSGALKLCFTAYAAVFYEIKGTLPSTTAGFNVHPSQVPLAIIDRLFHRLLVKNLEPIQQLSMHDQQEYALNVRKDLVKLGFLFVSQSDSQRVSKRHLRPDSTEAGYVSVASSLHLEHAHLLFQRSKSRTIELHAWNRILAESVVAEVERLDTMKVDIDFTDWRWKAALVRDSPTLDYALDWLPVHLIKAEMYHEAHSLLKTKTFVHDRLFGLGIDDASERVINDVHFLLGYFPRERKQMVKLAYKPIENILAQMLQQDRKGCDDRDKKKDGSIPSTGLNKDEVYKIGRAFWRLGQSLVQLNEFDAALPLWQHSLGAFSESPGRCTEITATIFYNIGILYGTKKLDHDEAIYHLTECLNIRREIHGENHILCSQALGALSDSFASIGELEDAKTGYRLSLDLLKNIPRQGRVLAGHLHERLGDVHFKQFNWKMALECYNSALLYKQAECGEGHQDLAHLYRQVGLVYTEMDDRSNLGLKNIEKAIQLTAAALKQRTNATGNHDKCEEAQLLQLRGLAKSLQDRRSESLRYYKESLKLYNEYMAELSVTSDEEPVIEKRHVASLLHSIACIYLQLGEYARAVHFFQESLNARRNISGQYMQCSMMEVSNTLFSMAQAYEKQGEADKALASFDEAILIRKTYFPDSETSGEVAAKRNE